LSVFKLFNISYIDEYFKRVVLLLQIKFYAKKDSLRLTIVPAGFYGFLILMKEQFISLRAWIYR